MNKLLFTMIAMVAFGAIGIVVYKTMEARNASQSGVTNEVSSETKAKDSCCADQGESCCQESMVAAKAGSCCSEQTEMVATKKSCGCSGCAESTVSTSESSKSCEHCQGAESSVSATCSEGAECSGQCEACAAAKKTETKSDTGNQ